MTITLDAETVGVAWAAAQVDVVVGTSNDPGPWTARVVDRYGTVLTTLPRAQLAKVSRRINQHGVSGFTLPRALVDTYDAIGLVQCELQVFRGSSLRFWGPILTEPGASTDDGKVTFGAAGFWSHFGYRLVGGWAPWSRNYLQNYRFDDGLARWLFSGDVTVDTGTFETGSQSAKVEPGGVLQQTFLVDLAVKFQLVVTARVRVEAAVTTGLGLVVSVPGVQGGDQFKTAPITASTPRDTWTTLTAVVNVEGRVGARSVSVALFGAAGGDVNLDNATATIYPITSLMESQPVEPVTDDMGTVVSQVIQATNTGLNVGVDSPVTGVTVPNTPDEWVDKTAEEIVRLFVDRENGLDFAEVFTATSRTIRTFYPRQGIDWDPEDLTLSCPGNLIKAKRSRNATNVVTEVTMVGDGGYRGVARDETAFGGLLRQKVMRAPSGVPVADLEGRARKELRLTVDAVTAIEAQMTMTDFITSGLGMGDRVLVQVDSLALQVDTVCRLVAVDENPVGDLADLVLNPEPVEGS